jgi:hypothetical protein
MMKIGQDIYAQPGAEGAPADWAAGEEKKDDDGVVDAEVEKDWDDKDDGKNTTRV